MEISYFNKVTDKQPTTTMGVDEFLNNVKNCVWSELIDPINAENDKAKRTKLKLNTLPCVTVSGTFTTRKKENIVNHSGVLCIDIDNSEDMDRDWAALTADAYTYAAFKSASGLGFAVFVLIDPKKHLESFLGLETYFNEKHGIKIDKSCKDITRPRFASADKDAFINRSAKKFTEIKKQPIKKIPGLITGKGDVEYLIEQITANSVDLTGDYEQWVSLGFAIADEYNEGGRAYYHAISQHSPQYDSKQCDGQYERCLRAGSSGVTIATLFFHAKEANLNLISPTTKVAKAAAIQGKRGGRNAEDVVKVLVEQGQLKKNAVKEIVEKVYESNEDLKLTGELSKLEQVELFLSHNYNLKRNEVTRAVENNGSEVDTVFLNSIYLEALRVVSDSVRFDTIERLISSDFVPNYNPLREFFERNATRTPEGTIQKMADTIETDTGLTGSNFDPDYAHRYFKKWLVGMVASAYGEHSPLLLVLTGGQNTGKTEFFRRLLPSELKPYIADSKLDAGKDDEILMTQKLMILDDEMGGKSKQEAKRLKELTSKAEFTLREPYGRKNVKLRRLAVLCGTSNDELILNDPTGNRRIIPINVISIDKDGTNSIDKTDLLIEAYHEYVSGYEWRLSSEDIKLLNQATGGFEQIRHERELIARYFKTPEFKTGFESVVCLTATDIKAEIEALSGQTLSQWKVGQELKGLGFEQRIKKVYGKTTRLYDVVKVDADKLEKEKTDITQSSAEAF